jgi:hypothetical protein
MTSNSTLSSFASVTSVGAFIEAVDAANARNSSRRTAAPVRKPKAKAARKPFGVAVTILSLFLVVAIFA